MTAALAARLSDAAAETQFLERAAVRLAAALAAREAGVPADAVFRPSWGGDRRSEAAKSADHARAVTAWLLHCGLGWTQERAADALGLARPNVSRSLKRLSDREETNPRLAAFLTEMETLLGQVCDGEAA